MSTITHSTGAGVILISKLHIPERLRREDAEVRRYIKDELAPSIREHGVIQPPTIFFDANNDQRPTLVAGWCRIQACIELGFLDIPYVLRDSLPRDVALSMELEENLRRKSMKWQHVCVGIFQTHTLKKQIKARDFEDWGMKQTGHLLKVAMSKVSNACVVAKELLKPNPNPAITQAASFEEAIRAILKLKADDASAALVRLSGTGAEVSAKKTRPSGLICEVGSEDLMPTRSDLEAVGDPKVQRSDSGLTLHENEVKLSDMLFHADCHEWLAKRPALSVDGIYTDIPFGIDMSMLEGIDNIELVEEAHDVDENVSQMKPFLEGIFRVLKDDSYAFLWYDIKHHEKLFGWAEEAGFKPQPFPNVWVKTHTCRNRAAHCNWTKSIEYVAVLKKGKPVLKTPQTKNYFPCSNEAERKMQRNPFAKPFEFSKWLLTPVIMEGQTWLDPYAGGGSLVRAMINLGLRPIGIEKDPTQFPLLTESIQNLYRSAFRNVKFT